MKTRKFLLSLTATVMISGVFVLPPALRHRTGDVIGQIEVTDRNINTEFTFDILSGNENNLFKIDENGYIYILDGKGVDRMSGKTITLRVRVCDNGVRWGHLHDKQVPLSVVHSECSEANIYIKVSRVSFWTRLWY